MLYTSPLLKFKANWRARGRPFALSSIERVAASVTVCQQRKQFVSRNAMKTRNISALLIALLAFTLAACGGKKASTPTEAFKSFYEAAKAKDAATIKRLLAKDALSKMEERAKQDKKSLDDFIVTQTQSGIPPSLPDTRNEKIDGDHATLEFKGPGGDSDWRTIPFIKEDGEWKILR